MIDDDLGRTWPTDDPPPDPPTWSARAGQALAVLIAAAIAVLIVAGTYNATLWLINP